MSRISLLDAPLQTNASDSGFWEMKLPTGDIKYIPNDIFLALPEHTTVAAEHQHVLAYIPWRHKYAELIPAKYREFFGVVLPYLHARTTDVHTAVSVSYLAELIANTPETVDETVTYLALIIHDSGWSKMSEQEIVDSLSYQALAHSEAAEGPKSKHDVLGHGVATEILGSYTFEPNLSEAQKEHVGNLVRNHTEPHKYKPIAEMPIELKLVCDADRLWSFTHENFWQDTVRKLVTPEAYEKSLEHAIDGYFLTSQGRAKARELLAERSREVARLPKFAA